MEIDINTQNRALKEINELKSVLSKLIGTSDLPARDQFSVEALNKLAREFKKLSIERGKWITDNDISKVIKKAPWRAGRFILKEFNFKNYFKKGHTGKWKLTGTKFNTVARLHFTFRLFCSVNMIERKLVKGSSGQRDTDAL